MRYSKQMFETTSRYNECADAFIGTTVGKIFRYKRRRFIPQDKENQITIIEISITVSDRIDLIASKFFGDPEQFWRLCDMNGIMHPLEITDEIGKIIKIKSEE